MQGLTIGIDAAVLGTLSAAVLLVTEVVKKSGKVPDGWGLYVAAILSAIVTWLVAYDLKVTSPVSLFVAFAQVLAQAAGAWGIVKAVTPDSITTARKTATMVLAVLLPTVTLGGCAARDNSRAAFVRADSAIYTSLAALQDTAIALNKSGVLKDADHKRVHAALVPALKTGLNINRVIRSWPADAPAPSEIRQLVQQVGDLTRAVLQEIPPGEARDRLIAGIAIVQQAILAVTIGVQGPIPVASAEAYGNGAGEPERHPGVGTGRRPTDTDWARVARAVEGGLQPAR